MPLDTENDSPHNTDDPRLDRRAAVLHDVEERGLLGPKDGTIGGRVSRALLDEAKRMTGISENTELLTYALAKLVLEDDFGERLLERKGRVAKGTLSAG